MNTNSHILTIDTYLGQMRSVVCGMAESPEKEQLTQLLAGITDELFEAHTDFAAMVAQIADLNRKLFEPVVRAQAGETCRYIDIDALNKGGVYTLEEFEKKLRQACESPASVLADFLRMYQKIGYLDFHKESKKSILKHLQECFPTMRRYGYTNFAANF